jgi:hypothetical protein
MLLAEIREQVIKYAASQGIITDEDELNFDAIDTDIDTAREVIAGKLLSGRKPSTSAWYLSTTIDYDLDIQPSPATKTIFQVPMAIAGIYSSFTGDDGKCNGTIVQTRTEYESSITTRIGKRFRGYVENRILTVNQKVGSIKLTAAFTRPKELIDFNVEVDNYPFDVQYMMDLQTMLADGFYKNIYKNAIDKKPDSANSLITPNQQ